MVRPAFGPRSRVPGCSASFGSSVSCRFFARSSSRISTRFFIAAGRGSSYHCLSRLIGHSATPWVWWRDTERRRRQRQPVEQVRRKDPAGVHTPAVRQVRPGHARRAHDGEPDGDERDATPGEQRDETDDRDEPWTADEIAKLSYASHRPFQGGEALHGLPELAELIHGLTKGRHRRQLLFQPRDAFERPLQPRYRFEARTHPREPIHRRAQRRRGLESRPNRHQSRHGRSKLRQRAHARVERGHRAHRLAQRGHALQRRIERRHRLHRPAQPLDALQRRHQHRWSPPSIPESPSCWSRSRPCCHRWPRCSA